jgi:hypothetical protein
MTEMTLHPSLGIRLFVPLAGIAGIVAGWQALANQLPKGFVFYSVSPIWWEGMGWLIIFCGVLWLVAGLVNLLPGATFLRLKAEGLCLSTLFYRQELKWDDVANFRLFQFNAPHGSLRSSFRARTFVVADISPDAKHPPKGMEKTRQAYGCDFFLPFTFGMSPQCLADVLNEWRLQHCSRCAS